MTLREKMHGGELYIPTDKELLEEQAHYMELLYDFNNTRPSEQSRRAPIGAIPA